MSQERTEHDAGIVERLKSQKENSSFPLSDEEESLLREIERLNAVIDDRDAQIIAADMQIDIHKQEIERLRATLGTAYKDIGVAYNSFPSEASELLIRVRFNINSVLKGVE